MTTPVVIRGNVAEPGSTQINNVNFTKACTVDDIDRACLRALRCPDTLLVKNLLKEQDKLLYKLIDWILQDPKYISWEDGDDVSLLWIKGGAGKGKTMISIGLIERLSLPQDEPTVVVYFFCQNANYKLNTIEAIIKGLILRLVNQQKELKELLRDRWDTVNERFNEDLTSWRALWNILLEMLDRCKSRRVYVIVDALDECQDEGVAEFLKLIVRTGLSYPSKIKWLLTCRSLDSAERLLLAGHDQVLISLDFNSKHLSEAVKAYIIARAAELDRLQKYGPALRRKVEDELTTKAEDTFLWVSLVCKRLEGVSRDKVLTAIHDLPPGLHPFYSRIFDQLSKGESALVERCMRLLKVMLLVYRPLKVDEVSSVTGLSDEDFAIEALVDRCASFVKKQGTDIEFVHQSARDYLGGKHAQSVIDSYEQIGHGEIALSCLSYLSGRLKFNLADLLRPTSTRESVKALSDTKRNLLLASVDYAATFWAQHLKDAKRSMLIQNALADQKEVDMFLHTKLLEWLECLSLLDKLPRSMEALKILRDAIDLKKGALLSIFVEDIARFLLRHYQTIATWPLQIYSSTIAFSPQTSAVRKDNLAKVPKWLRKLPQIEDTWTSLIQTLTGHSGSVLAVAFSPNSTWIASASRDNTVKLWDTATGGLKKTLVDHSDSIFAIAFSPDGTWIASASRDNTVKLWDTATGRLGKTLTGHSDSVFAVVFSPNGIWIASASRDNTVKLWDTTTGSSKKTLIGHSCSVLAVVFSPDGNQIASVSEDNTIKLWDTITGGLKKTFVGHSGSLAAVAFSSDGKRIASASYDNTVKLWDTATGNLERTLAGYSGSVMAIAFSPDGKWIASGSRDNTVKLWDTTTGGLKKTFVGHSSWVFGVVFSLDGRQIASASDDNTIKLWDAMTDDLEKTSAVHSGWVVAVLLSPDGKRIASVSGDRNIKLWDAATGSLERILVGHSDSVTATAFLPDGTWIVSVSRDKTVKLWDTATGNLKKTFVGHSESVLAVTFSPDGKQIASASLDDTVKLWDTMTGGHKTLVGHSSPPTAVVFSLDGRLIASASRDNTVKLWDAATGRLKKTLVGHSDWVMAVAFSPDSKRIASASRDHTVRLWDVAKFLKASSMLGGTINSRIKLHALQEIKTLGTLSSLKFSENGRYLVTDLGPIKIESTLIGTQSADCASLEDLWVQNQWIYYGAVPVFRLTLDFESRCYDGRDDQIAIGFTNGLVLSFAIDRRSLNFALKPPT